MLDSLFLTLFFIPGVLLRITPFKKLIEKKQRIWTLSAQMCALLFHCVCMDVITKYIGVSPDVLKIDVFAFELLITGVYILILKSHVREHLFTCGLVMLQDFLVLSGVEYLLNKSIWFYDETDKLLLLSIYSLAVQLIFYWFFRKLIVSAVRPFLLLETKNYWNGIWFISVLMFASCFFSLPLNDLANSRFAITAVFLQYIVIIAMCRTMVNDSLAIKERLQLEKDLTLQQSHYVELANRIEEARKSRHDFKHHITLVHQYLDTKDYDGLREYCNGLQTHNNLHVSIPYTGNPAIDGIVYHYATIAKENGIDFDYKKINPPEISNIDLCTLLGNALDNAVTACKNVKENPFIKIIPNGEGEGMQLLIRNSYDGIIKKDKNKFITRKTEGDHGIGVSSMQEICDKNDILMKIAYTDEVFDVLFVF